MATRKQFALGLRWLVSVGLLAWILNRPELSRLGAEWHRADLRWLTAGLFFGGVTLVIGAKRWQVCLRSLGIHAGLGGLFKITLSAAAAGCISFGALGVDVAKFVLLGRDQPGRHAAILSSLAMDHASALPCVATMLITAIIAHRAVPRLDVPGAWLILAVAVAVVFVTWLVRWKFRKFHEACLKILKNRKTWIGWLTAVAWSVPLWLAYCGIFYCSARALGIDVPVAGFTGVIAIADGVAALPISIAGLGVREQAFRILLEKWYAIPPAAAVAMSLTGFALSLVWAAVGALGIPRFSMKPDQPATIP